MKMFQSMSMEKKPKKEKEEYLMMMENLEKIMMEEKRGKRKRKIKIVASTLKRMTLKNMMKLKGKTKI